jgi:hypothetical protein
MSDGKLVIEITGDEAKAHAAYMALNKDQKMLVAEIGKMGAAAETAANQTIQMAKKESKERQDQIRLAESLVKKHESLSQAYERQKTALDQALQSGSITAEQHKQTLDSLNEKVRTNSTEYIEAAKQQQAADKVTVDLRNEQIRIAEKIVEKTETITERYAAQKAALDAALGAGGISTEQYDRAMQHIQQEADEATKKLNDIEPAMDKGFGRSAQDLVVGWGTHFFSAAAAVGVVSEALRTFSKDRDEALSIGATLEQARTNLRGLSADFGELEKRADTIALETGLDRVKSRDVIFTGESQGVPFQDQMLAARLRKNIDPNTAIAFMADMKDQFPSENLTGAQAVNMAMVAANESKFNPTSFLPQLQTAAVGAGTAGWSSVDTSAMVGVLASTFGQSTGTRINALASKVGTNEQFRGMDGIEALYKLSQFSDEEMKEFVGGDRTAITTINAAIERLPKIEELANKTWRQKRVAGTEHSMAEQKLQTTFDMSTHEGRIASKELMRDKAKRVNEIVKEKKLRDALEVETDDLLRDAEYRELHDPIDRKIYQTLDWMDQAQSDLLGTKTFREMSTGITPEYQEHLLQRNEGRYGDNELQRQQLQKSQEQIQKTDQQTSAITTEQKAQTAALNRIVDKISEIQIVGV